jgi:hypothetical protein
MALPAAATLGKRSKIILGNIGLLLFTLILCLVLGEIVVRIAIPQQLIVPNHHLWRPDEMIGWRHVENTNTQINTGEGMVHFVTDDNGCRINYPPSDEPVATPDISIFTVGDSFLEAVQVENRQTIPQILQRTLGEKYDKKMKVVNHGVGGWNPNQYLIETGRALAQRKYDLGIIFLYVSNDIVSRRQTSFSPAVVSAQHHFRLPRSLKWSELIDAFFYPVNDQLETSSHLFVLLKNRSQVILARLGLTAEYFPPIFEKQNSDSDWWQMTTEVCRDIDSIFVEHQTPVFFVLFPASYQVDQEAFYDYVNMFGIDPDAIDLEQPNHLLQQRFSAAKLRLTDPLEQMRGLAAEGLAMFGSVDSHLNENGHLIVAKFILPVVEEYLGSSLAK